MWKKIEKNYLITIDERSRTTFFMQTATVAHGYTSVQVSDTTEV